MKTDPALRASRLNLLFLGGPPREPPELNYSRRDRVYKSGTAKPEAPSSNNYDHRNRRWMACVWSVVGSRVEEGNRKRRIGP